jgi:hypothetical protein
VNVYISQGKSTECGRVTFSTMSTFASASESLQNACEGMPTYELKEAPLRWDIIDGT